MTSTYFRLPTLEAALAIFGPLQDKRALDVVPFAIGLANIAAARGLHVTIVPRDEHHELSLYRDGADTSLQNIRILPADDTARFDSSGPYDVAFAPFDHVADDPLTFFAKMSARVGALFVYEPPASPRSLAEAPARYGTLNAPAKPTAASLRLIAQRCGFALEAYRSDDEIGTGGFGVLYAKRPAI